MSVYYGNYLIHHGIKGQHWGERNYQNPDGSLTAAGRERYRNAFSPKALAIKANGAFITGVSAPTRLIGRGLKKAGSALSKHDGAVGAIGRRVEKVGKKIKWHGDLANMSATSKRLADKYQKEANAKRDAKDYGGQQTASRVKKAAAVGAGIAATALATYGVYKLGKAGKLPINAQQIGNSLRNASSHLRGAGQAVLPANSTAQFMPPAISSNGRNMVGQVLRASNSIGNMGLNEVVVDHRPKQIAAIAGGAAAIGAGAYAANRARQNRRNRQYEE